MKKLLTVVLFLVSATVAFADDYSDTFANKEIAKCNNRRTQSNIIVCKYSIQQDVIGFRMKKLKNILAENNKDGDREAIVATTRKISLLSELIVDRDYLSGQAMIAIDEKGFAKANADADKAIRISYSYLVEANEELDQLTE